MKQVLLLAKRCGVSEPGEVSTFDYLPGGGMGVQVKSVERVQGRDIAVDEMTIGRLGWTDLTPGKDAQRVGKFWAGPSDKFTRHLRVYEFRGKRIRVIIGDGVSTELADKIIPLIAAKKVRFGTKNDGFRIDSRDMEEMIGLKPRGLSKQHDGALWLHFEDTMDALQFRFEKGEVIAEQVIHIVV
jgi:hypothetical protein